MPKWVALFVRSNTVALFAVTCVLCIIKVNSPPFLQIFYFILFAFQAILNPNKLVLLSTVLLMCL